MWNLSKGIPFFFLKYDTDTDYFKVNRLSAISLHRSRKFPSGEHYVKVKFKKIYCILFKHCSQFISGND